MVFCTLFDSNYLDKGIVMYKSLASITDNFKLYILAMDDICYKVLSDLELEHVVLISLDEFLDDDLKQARENRSVAEFCWTCSSCLIYFVLTKYNEESCTYIDSDLYFYGDPQCLLDEIGDKDAQIVEHRFRNTVEDRLDQKHSGTYCVEFNTIRNSPGGMKLVTWWKEQCLNSCSVDPTGKVFGDQKYIEQWKNYSNVSVLKNLGGGVAPWNVGQYSLVSHNDDRVLLQEQKTGKNFMLIFYHFHMINYLDAHRASISVYHRFDHVDDELIHFLYLPYLKKLDETKNFLRDKYGVYPFLLKHPSKENIHKRSLIERIKNINDETIPKLYSSFIRGKRRKLQGHKDIIEF